MPSNRIEDCSLCREATDHTEGWSQGGVDGVKVKWGGVKVESKWNGMESEWSHGEVKVEGWSQSNFHWISTCWQHNWCFCKSDGISLYVHTCVYTHWPYICTELVRISIQYTHISIQYTRISIQYTCISMKTDKINVSFNIDQGSVDNIQRHYMKTAKLDIS